jgi:CO/xanthine dehydrogenase FAD-binding subunit
VRSYIPAYDLRVPATLGEVLDLIASEQGRWRPFAGGTDLMVLLEAGRLQHSHYVSLTQLQELRFIEVTEPDVMIGALTTYIEVRRHPVLQVEFPLLGLAASETGGAANQNRGTIGGNIANASPAADTPPALLAYDAELELISRRGTRRVPYERFHTGYKRMDLASDELIRSVRLPRRAGIWRQFYRKVGTRRAQAISKVCLAGAMSIDRSQIVDVRIGIGSVAPTVIRARSTERAITGRPLDAKTIAAAREAIATDISPIDDLRSTAAYRLEVARNLVQEFLTST